MKKTETISMSEGCDLRQEEGLANVETDLALHKDTVYFLRSDVIGQGDAQLGKILIKSFFYTLSEADHVPGTLIFLNSAVLLACEGSPVVESLLALEERGTQILSCGTCLDYYQMKEKVLSGKVSNMYTIVEHLNSATKVVSL
ncbi:sulfurtransferase-like selenium metabolism protein YedF [Heliorestis acidaminivorans]|uniref:Sulfurtransferase-like selenium metabolism protein YedF n=1 Tax=Heliorestis acidaminivorans TaxID=553427 RepID=A0A6I0F4V8_9FIRM|nr:sulfurtransferase-like selenium metabolism protein YedF [Heliorestis acidaminivorans]KAB2953872.1 sulfurtransferase-like selenium metabolism protein YedF [Heliorestis acidaminivorans]